MSPWRRALPTLALVLAFTAPAAAAEEPGLAMTEAQLTGGFPVDLLPDCQDRFRAASDGSFRQGFADVELQNGLASLPPRVAIDLDRGDRETFCVGFQNLTDEPVSLELRVGDVAASAEGNPRSQQEAAEFGASRWIRPATTLVRDLPSGEVAWVPVTADVPADAVPGSAYASIMAQQPGSDDGGGGTSLGNVPAVTVQIFLDLPGEVRRGGRVTDPRAPGLIWWDGLDLGDLPVLDDLRGLGVATVRFGWRNEGSYSEQVKGRVVIRSSLTGKTVTTIDVDPQLVLRGAERDFAATWSQDVPLVGRFVPTLEIEHSDGDPKTYELDPIWVMPSWWYLLALALAFAVPVWLRLRSRRRYRALVARVEAAEGRQFDAGFDDEFEADDRY